MAALYPVLLYQAQEAVAVLQDEYWVKDAVEPTALSLEVEEEEEEEEVEPELLDVVVLLAEPVSEDWGTDKATTAASLEPSWLAVPEKEPEPGSGLESESESESESSQSESMSASATSAASLSWCQ